MGIWEKFKGEFIDVIEWVDDSTDTLVYRFPTYNREIQTGSSLIVRESQRAIFVYKGKIADSFGPGHHKLSTENLPVLTTLLHWTHGLNTPFKSDIYYFNTRQFTDLKWGTPNPIILRDPEFGAVRVRSFGVYSLCIENPEKVIKELSGTEERYKVDQIDAQMGKIIVSRFSDFIAESKIPMLDYAANLGEFSEALQKKLLDDFKGFGLGLKTFYIENISLPQDVEAVLDKRTGMKAVGADMDQYMKFQVADSVKDAAKNEGGVAGVGAGAGIGFAVGNAVMGSMGQTSQSAQKIMVRCPSCSKLNEEAAKFCSECGTQLIKGPAQQ